MSSVQVYFAFSTGLATSVMVPVGTLASALQHVENVEAALGLKRTQYRDNPVHWDTSDPAYRSGFPDVDDQELCQTVSAHNGWVRRFYDDLANWSANPIADGETLTEADAQTFWHGLRLLKVEPNRWTREYYRERMEHYYDVMRGRPSEGVNFGVAKLSPKQAGAVIWMLSDLLDGGDIRLEVPRGCDHLASSYDGEYDWCTRCGAVLPEDASNCRKRGCPVQAEWCDEDRPEWFKPAKGQIDSPEGRT